jgi:hypothetical protein
MDQDQQQKIDLFFKTRAVLSSKMRSRRRWSGTRASRPPEVEVPPQANWKDVGRELRVRYIAGVGQRCDCDWCSWYQHTRRGRRENYWVVVVALAIEGDPSTLVKHLNSRKILTRFDRIVLADLLDAAFKGETRAALHPLGRPKKIAAQSCATVALRFYGDWKANNRRLGVRDWGHSDEMKDQACHVAIEFHRLSRKGTIVLDHPMNVLPSFDEVRELISRSKARRQ